MRVTSTFLLKIAVGLLLLLPPFMVFYEASNFIYNCFTIPYLPQEALAALPIIDPRELPRLYALMFMKGMWLPVAMYLSGIFLLLRLWRGREFEEHELHLLHVLAIIMLTLIPLWLATWLHADSKPKVLQETPSEWVRHD